MKIFEYNSYKNSFVQRFFPRNQGLDRVKYSIHFEDFQHLPVDDTRCSVTLFQQLDESKTGRFVFRKFNLLCVLYCLSTKTKCMNILCTIIY